MNVVIWIATGMLAGVFVIAGLAKVATPREKLKEQGMAYVEDYSDSTIKLIGAVEILAAIGLILPGILDIATLLVPLAATGLALIMVGAIAVHYRRQESGDIPKNVVILALALFVAIMRFGPYPL